MGLIKESCKKAMQQKFFLTFLLFPVLITLGTQIAGPFAVLVSNGHLVHTFNSHMQGLLLNHNRYMFDRVSSMR